MRTCWITEAQIPIQLREPTSYLVQPPSKLSNEHQQVGILAGAVEIQVQSPKKLVDAPAENANYLKQNYYLIE